MPYTREYIYQLNKIYGDGFVDKNPHYPSMGLYLNSDGSFSVPAPFTLEQLEYERGITKPRPKHDAPDAQMYYWLFTHGKEDGRSPFWEQLDESLQSTWNHAFDYMMSMINRNFEEELSGRDKLQIQFCQLYAEHFENAGIPGHNLFILIAKLADQLGIFPGGPSSLYQE